MLNLETSAAFPLIAALFKATIAFIAFVELILKIGLSPSIGVLLIPSWSFASSSFLRILGSIVAAVLIDATLMNLYPEFATIPGWNGAWALWALPGTNSTVACSETELAIFRV